MRLSRLDNKNRGRWVVFLYTGALCCLSALLSASTITWNDAASDDSYWSTPGNWNPVGLPGVGSTARIINGVGPCVINEGTTAVTANMEGPGWSALADPEASCDLVITGGTLDILTGWELIRNAGSVGRMTIRGGVVNAPILRAWHGDLLINMTGGELNIKGNLEIPRTYTTTGYGQLNLHGGVVRCGSLLLNTVDDGFSLVDIEAGELIIDGDRRSTINGYVAKGQMTAYGGSQAGTLKIDYDPGENTTTITADYDPGSLAKAWNPYPKDNAHVNADVVMSWNEGLGAVWHNVFFGTVFPPPFVQQQIDTAYNPNGLDLNTTYYWRVDQVDARGNVWTGDVWSFVVRRPLVKNYQVDDFVLSGYTVQESISASSGQYVHTDDFGLIDVGFDGPGGIYDIEIHYFDTNGGISAYTFAVDGKTVGAWLSDGNFGSSEPDNHCRTRQTLRNVELQHGSSIQIQGIRDGNDGASVDNLLITTCGSFAPASSFNFNSTSGLPLALILNGQQRLSHGAANAGFYFGVFDGHSFKEKAYRNILINGHLMEVSEAGGLPRFTFRIDEYDRHVNLSLINVEGLPMNDSSVALRLRVPVNCKVNVAETDSYTVSEVLDSSFSIYWTELGNRSGRFPVGNIALYAAEDQAAISEINSVNSPVAYGIADFNVDGYVDILDFSILAGAWLSEQLQPEFNHVCDVMADGTIDLQDLATFILHWFSSPRVGTYQLTVNNGTGSGDYVEGTDVSISADNPPAGCIFAGWTGDVDAIADVDSPTTIFTMPPNDSMVSAVYKSDYQAEAYSSALGCHIQSIWGGYTGTGYVVMGGAGTWFEWNNVDGNNGGERTLVFRYAASSNRQCQISVNGVMAGNMTFASTGNLSNWLTESIDVMLNGGLNTIRITAATSNGGPNVDKMSLYVQQTGVELFLFALLD